MVLTDRHAVTRVHRAFTLVRSFEETPRHGSRRQSLIRATRAVVAAGYAEALFTAQQPAVTTVPPGRLAETKFSSLTIRPAISRGCCRRHCRRSQASPLSRCSRPYAAGAPICSLLTSSSVSTLASSEALATPGSVTVVENARASVLATGPAAALLLSSPHAGPAAPRLGPGSTVADTSKVDFVHTDPWPDWQMPLLDEEATCSSNLTSTGTLCGNLVIAGRVGADRQRRGIAGRCGAPPRLRRGPLDVLVERLQARVIDRIQFTWATRASAIGHGPLWMSAAHQSGRSGCLSRSSHVTSWSVVAASAAVDVLGMRL